MMRARHLSVSVCALLFLGACVSTRPTGVALTAEAERTLLTGLAAFSFEGRTAIVSGETATNAALDWRQKGSDSDLRLSGPLGMGSLQVALKQGALLITTSRGEKLESANALHALTTQLGFEPPFNALRFWVLGVPAPGGDAVEQLDGDGRLASLEQQGWRVSYEEYRQQATPHGSLRLPRRLTARRDALQLRVVIDRWVLAR